MLCKQRWLTNTHLDCGKWELFLFIVLPTVCFQFVTECQASWCSVLKNYLVLMIRFKITFC